MTVSGATVDILVSLGLDPEADGPLIEWRTPDDGGDWITDADRSHGLISYATTYGRPDARSKVPPGQVSMRGAREIAEAPDLGDLFRITLCDPAAAALGLTEDEAARFTGEITDVTLDQAGRTWTAIGVGTLARKARRALDLTLSGTAAADVQWLDVITGLDLADIVDEVETTLTLLAAPSAPAPGSTLLDVIASSTLGQTVQDLDGLVSWHDPEHRRGAIPVLTLGASEILNQITWAKHVGSVVNVAIVNYRGGTITVTDHASVGARGEYPLTVTTTLTTASDARALGSLIVGRFSTPAWDLPILTVDVPRTVDPAHLAEVLEIRHADRLTITDLPAEGPIAGASDFYVEGFGETAARYVWRLGLSVSDPRLSGVSIRWIDVLAPDFPPVTVDGGHSGDGGPFTLTIDGGHSGDVGGSQLPWENVYHAIRWLDVAAMEDPADLGAYARTYDGGHAA